MDVAINVDSKLNKVDYYNGVLIGLFLSADMVIKIVTALLPIQNFLVLYYISIVFIGFAINKTKMGVKYIYLYIFIATIFCISLIAVIDVTYTFQYLIYFSTFYLASSALQFNIDKNRVFKTINYINIPFTLFLYFVIFKSYSDGTLNLDYTMNLSYTALIGISAFLLSFKLSDFKHSKFFMLMNSICVLVEIYFMLTISNNRGSLVGLAFLLVLFIMMNLKKPLSRVFLIGIFATIAIYIYNNLYNIIISLNNLFVKFNIPSNFLSKIIWKLEYEDFSSGRFEYFSDALTQFYNNPFFGRGIGHFSAEHDGSYPHNIFIDLLSSSGIFITTLLLVFCFICLFRLVMAKTNDYIVLVSLLITLSIPQLLVSSTLWMSPFFWALIVLILFNPDSKQYRIFS